MTGSRARLALALLVAVAALPDAAARTVRSAHFVITHPASADVADLAVALEGGYRRVRDFGLRLPASIAVTVHATTSEFAARSGAGRMHLAGVRASRLHLQPMGVLRRQAGLDRALAHELVHVALLRGATRMPRWLFEGVAMLAAGERHPIEGAYASPAALDHALQAAESHDAARRAYAKAGALARTLEAHIGHARMLSALRATGTGSDAGTVFRKLAGIDLEAWAAARVGGPNAAPNGRRR